MRSVSAKACFLVASLLLAIAGNYLRSLYLSLTAHRSGLEALEGVHDAAGWTVLLGTVVGLGALACLVKSVEARVVEEGA